MILERCNVEVWYRDWAVGGLRRLVISGSLPALRGLTGLNLLLVGLGLDCDTRIGPGRGCLQKNVWS